MKSDSGLAGHAVAALEEGSFDLVAQCVNELELFHSPSKVTRLLAEAGAGLAYLRQAAAAAGQGNPELSTRLYKCAFRYIDEDEAVALAEEHRLSFIVQPVPEVPERDNRHGFVASVC